MLPCACLLSGSCACAVSRVHKFARVPVFLRFQRAGGCGVVQAAVAAATAACTNFRLLPPPPNSLLHRIFDGERRILDRVRRILEGYVEYLGAGGVSRILDGCVKHVSGGSTLTSTPHIPTPVSPSGASGVFLLTFGPVVA